MYELFWKISFALFLAALPLNALHMILALGLKKADWLRWLRLAGEAAIGLGMAGLTAAIVARWIASGRPPFTNMPESLLWMAWAFCAIYFAARRRVTFAGLAFGVSLGAVAILAFSAQFDQAPRPLMPALRSNWLIFHVFTCMVSYGAFFAAFCIGAIGLAFWRKRESLEALDGLLYQVIAFGFLMLTVGVVTGSVWGYQAWGRYWGWDPKETWALITWLVYAICLHARVAGGAGAKAERRMRMNVLFAIGGFVVVIFTYVGVTFLMSGPHSYAG